jgi:quinol monooxygenase YgiN
MRPEQPLFNPTIAASAYTASQYRLDRNNPQQMDESCRMGQSVVPSELDERKQAPNNVLINPGRSPMIHVIAIITTLPGKRETVLEAFRANMAAVHAEEGCIEYAPAIDATPAGGMQTELGADSFVVIEKWASMDALAAHAASSHMAAYGAKTRPMLANRIIHVLTPVA